jgi:hypothetical protein
VSPRWAHTARSSSNARCVAGSASSRLELRDVERGGVGGASLSDEEIAEAAQFMFGHRPDRAHICSERERLLGRPFSPSREGVVYHPLTA